jgi:hypothetical protein
MHLLVDACITPNSSWEGYLLLGFRTQQTHEYLCAATSEMTSTTPIICPTCDYAFEITFADFETNGTVGCDLFLGIQAGDSPSSLGLANLWGVDTTSYPMPVAMFSYGAEWSTWYDPAYNPSGYLNQVGSQEHFQFSVYASN